MRGVQLDEQADMLVDETVDGATLQDYLFMQGDWATDCTERAALETPGEGQEVEEGQQAEQPETVQVCPPPYTHCVCATADRKAHLPCHVS